MKKQNKRIIILGALDVEITAFLTYLKNSRKRIWKESTFYEGQLYGKKVVIAKSGVGKVLSAMTTQKLIDVYNPRFVLFTGVAGALNKKYNIGDIIVCKDCVQHDVNVTKLGFLRGHIPYTDYRFIETDAQLRDLALSVQIEHTIHKGRIVTGDQFLTKKEIKEYEYLIDELRGDAVEMEGASVGQVCIVNEIPFLIIRTISDKADEKASTDFHTFLPEVVKNSIHMVQYLLENCG